MTKENVCDARVDSGKCEGVDGAREARYVTCGPVSTSQEDQERQVGTEGLSEGDGYGNADIAAPQC